MFSEFYTVYLMNEVKSIADELIFYKFYKDIQFWLELLMKDNFS